MRDREDDMKVGERNQLGDATSGPLLARHALTLGAMAIAAGVVGDAEVLPTSGAVIAMAAERCGAAALDGAHDLQMKPCDVRPAAIEEVIAGCAEDVGHLEGGPVHLVSGSAVAVEARVSKGLATVLRCRVDKWTYQAVSRNSTCPSRDCRVHRSAP